MSKEHVVLVTMLKNEAENVLQMLASVEGLYSAVVAGFDDKATDGTKDLVLQYFQDKGDIEQVFYDFTWTNSFAEARNHYHRLAREKFPNHAWLLIMDGDDLLSHGDPSRGVPDGRDIIRKITSTSPEQFGFKAVNFYVYLDPDPISGIPTLFYPRCHLVRNEYPDIQWQFASHNAITVPGEQQVLVREAVIIHHQKPKKRAEREKQRLEMNVPNLQQQGQIDGLDGARGLFYLGNTLLDGGDLDGAEKAFLAYLEKSTWADERYQARLHLCALYLLRGDAASAEHQAKEAMQEENQWARAEAYVVLSDCALVRGNVLAAIHWLRTATLCKPPVTGLFLQGHLYTWFPHWRLAMLLDRLGCYREALQHAQKAMEYRPAPEVVMGTQALAQYVADLQARGLEIASLDKLESYVPIYHAAHT